MPVCDELLTGKLIAYFGFHSYKFPTSEFSVGRKFYWVSNERFRTEREP